MRRHIKATFMRHRPVPARDGAAQKKEEAHRPIKGAAPKSSLTPEESLLFHVPAIMRSVSRDERAVRKALASMVLPEPLKVPELSKDVLATARDYLTRGWSIVDASYAAAADHGRSGLTVTWLIEHLTIHGVA